MIWLWFIYSKINPQCNVNACQFLVNTKSFSSHFIQLAKTPFFCNFFLSHSICLQISQLILLIHQEVFFAGCIMYMVLRLSQLGTIKGWPSSHAFYFNAQLFRNTIIVYYYTSYHFSLQYCLSFNFCFHISTWLKLRL